MAKKKYKYFALIADKNGSISVTEESSSHPQVNEIVFMDSKSMRFAKLLDRPSPQAEAEHIEIINDESGDPFLVYAKYTETTTGDEEGRPITTTTLFLDNNGNILQWASDLNDYLTRKIGIGFENKYIVRELGHDEIPLNRPVNAYSSKRLLIGLRKYMDVFHSKTELKKAVRLLLREEYGFMAICKNDSDEIETADIDICESLVEDGYQIQFIKKDKRKMFPFFEQSDEACLFLEISTKVLKYCDHGRFTPTLIIDLIDSVDEFCATVNGLDNRETRTAFIRYLETFSSPANFKVREVFDRAAACADILSKAAKLYLKTEDDLYFLHHTKVLFPYHFHVIPESEQEMLKVFAINEKNILPFKYEQPQLYNNSTYPRECEVDEDEIPF